MEHRRQTFRCTHENTFTHTIVHLSHSLIPFTCTGTFIRAVCQKVKKKKQHRDKVRRGMRNILLQLRCLDVISSSWLNLNLIQWKSCHIWNLLHVTASHTRLKMDFAVSKRNFDLPKFRFFSAFLSHSLMTSFSHCDFIFGKNKVFIDAISHLKMNQMLSVLACWWRMAALLNDS